MKYPWMPLFWGDFLANTMHLSAHEAGAYLFLIAHAWEHGGQIPGDPARLRRIAHVEPKNWSRCWTILEVFFEPISRGDPLREGYLSKRVTAELQRLGKISNNRKAAAVQMHSKCSKFASTSTSTSNSESFFSEEGKPSAVQMHGTFYADFGSPELDAWNAYERTIGKSTPRDKRGGWNFPSQWPPQINGPKP